MIDNELALAQETSSSAGLLPSSGDDSVSPLESGVLDNNSTLAFSDPYSQEITELTKTSSTSNYDLTNNYVSQETSDGSSANEDSLLATDAATEADLLTGNTLVGAATPEPLYGFSSTDVTIDDLSGANMTLNTIETTASNIVLQANDGTVPSSDAPAAVNGGFFTPSPPEGSGGILSIAVNDDTPIAGPSGDNFIGLNNDFTSRGTLYWDGDTNTAGVEQVSDVDGLTNITDRSNYWAQGGISMDLNSTATEDANGLTPTINGELSPGLNGGATEGAPRTALVYDDISNNGTGETGTDVYLITTEDSVTLGEFRSAIQQTYTTAEDGIFLDGGGSTQIKSPDFNSSGSDPAPGRDIPQIVALESTTNPA